MKSIKILIICTGNSCRSQMAHGFLKSFDKRMAVYSAGTQPAGSVNKNAVRVMAETGIDISSHVPVPVDTYIKDDWDYVITVCDGAHETCPVFPGKVKYRLHKGFEDPYLVRGTEEYVLGEYRRIRDQIHDTFLNLYSETFKKQLDEV